MLSSVLKTAAAKRLARRRTSPLRSSKAATAPLRATARKATPRAKSPTRGGQPKAVQGVAIAGQQQCVPTRLRAARTQMSAQPQQRAVSISPAPAEVQSCKGASSPLQRPRHGVMLAGQTKRTALPSARVVTGASERPGTPDVGPLATLAMPTPIKGPLTALAKERLRHASPRKTITRAISKARRVPQLHSALARLLVPHRALTTGALLRPRVDNEPPATEALPRLLTTAPIRPPA